MLAALKLADTRVREPLPELLGHGYRLSALNRREGDKIPPAGALKDFNNWKDLVTFRQKCNHPIADESGLPLQPEIPFAAMALPPPLLPDPVYSRAVDLLLELTALTSASGDAEGLHRAAARLAKALAEHGLDTEIRAESVAAGPPLPVLYARGRPADEGSLLLIGHLDTVLAAAPPRREADRLIATGAIDMKGGLAAFAGALDLLRQRGVEPPAGLLLVVVPDEEVGGEHSRAAVARWGAGARALWVLEPGEPTADGGETIVAGRRGMFQWRLQVRGRAAHSGLHYWEGRSALAAAARWVAAAEALSRPSGGPTVNTGRLVGGDAGFVDDLAQAHGLLGGDRQLNVVPDRAVAEGEARFLCAADRASLANRLESVTGEIAAGTETTCTLEIYGDIPPVDPNTPHAAWSQKAVDLAARSGWHLEIETERGGISFPNFLPNPGAIPILDGLGPVGGGMHTREEYVSLTSFQRRIVLLADLLAAAGDASYRSPSVER
jgi:glutamate carboxypeptidase